MQHNTGEECNEYGVPLHACAGYKNDEHYWAWIMHAKPADREVEVIIERLGVRNKPGLDNLVLDQAIADVLAANPASIAQIQAGKDKAINALIGQVMKASKGKGDPAKVKVQLLEKIAEMASTGV